MTDSPQPPLDLDKIEARANAATVGPWRSMRDGNQYIDTRYIPTAKCVGASRIEEIQRPWNPHQAIAFGMPAEKHEVARFLDADGDFIAHARTDIPALVAEVRRLRAVSEKWAKIAGENQDIIEQPPAPLPLDPSPKALRAAEETLGRFSRVSGMQGAESREVFAQLKRQITHAIAAQSTPSPKGEPPPTELEVAHELIGNMAKAMVLAAMPLNAIIQSGRILDLNPALQGAIYEAVNAINDNLPKAPVEPLKGRSDLEGSGTHPAVALAAQAVCDAATLGDCRSELSQRLNTTVSKVPSHLIDALERALKGEQSEPTPSNPSPNPIQGDSK